MDEEKNPGNRVERLLKEFDPESLNVDELWQVHERVEQALRAKIQSEKEKLDAQMSRLGGLEAPQPPATAKPAAGQKPERRPYPEVKPKYRSLKDPSLMWAGRGKQPRWLLAEMKGGKTLDDFLITGKASVRKKSR